MRNVVNTRFDLEVIRPKRIIVLVEDTFLVEKMNQAMGDATVDYKSIGRTRMNRKKD